MDEPPAEEEPGKRVQRVRRAARTADADSRLYTASRLLRRVLPGDERYGDPLSTAGDEARQALARRISALETERPSAARELALGAFQVLQAFSEKSGRGRGDQDLTIVFTDLVGFSDWALEAQDDALVALLRAVNHAVEGAFVDHGGRIVKRLGDGVMAVFLDPDEAVAGAFAAQEALDGVEVDGYRPRMRIGLHTGKPRRLGGDYLGVDVNVASRVADAAKAGEVLVSDATCDRLDPDAVVTKRRLWFRARGAPRDMGVHSVRRA